MLTFFSKSCGSFFTILKKKKKKKSLESVCFLKKNKSNERITQELEDVVDNDVFLVLLRDLNQISEMICKPTN